LTRTPIPFSVALLVGEVLRRHLRPEKVPSFTEEQYRYHRPPLVPWIRSLWPRIDWRPTIRDLMRGGVPAAALASTAFLFNYLRFDRLWEFGHYYLNVRWTERIQRWGLFNYHFISRNLAAMFTLLPKIMVKAPYVKISWHGLSLPFTTPFLAYAIWPQRRSPVQPWLYLAVLFPLLSHLLYQNTGWVQFGYRFSLDYMVYLVAALAVGGCRLGNFAKALILFGVAVNTFGAITFGRYWQFYWDSMFPIP
jgi:hypothetical protein